MKLQRNEAMWDEQGIVIVVPLTTLEDAPQGLVMGEKAAGAGSAQNLVGSIQPAENILFLHSIGF